MHRLILTDAAGEAAARGASPETHAAIDWFITRGGGGNGRPIEIVVVRLAEPESFDNAIRDRFTDALAETIRENRETAPRDLHPLFVVTSAKDTVEALDAEMLADYGFVRVDAPSEPPSNELGRPFISWRGDRRGREPSTSRYVELANWLREQSGNVIRIWLDPVGFRSEDPGDELKRLRAALDRRVAELQEAIQLLRRLTGSKWASVAALIRKVEAP